MLRQEERLYLNDELFFLVYFHLSHKIFINIAAKFSLFNIEQFVDLFY